VVNTNVFDDIEFIKDAHLPSKFVSLATEFRGVGQMQLKVGKTEIMRQQGIMSKRGRAEKITINL
jgi:hypothetical protein